MVQSPITGSETLDAILGSIYFALVFLLPIGLGVILLYWVLRGIRWVGKQTR